MFIDSVIVESSVTGVALLNICIKVESTVTVRCLDFGSADQYDNFLCLFRVRATDLMAIVVKMSNIKEVGTYFCCLFLLHCPASS